MPTMDRMKLRLTMPQWQGRNAHDYFFGSRRLAWLALAASEIIFGLGLWKRRQK